MAETNYFANMAQVFGNLAFLGSSAGKESTCNAGGLSLIPGL